MKLEDSISTLKQNIGTPFSVLFPQENHMPNKGRTGTLIEQLVGLDASGPRMLDFDNGEMKTYKSKPSYKAVESIAIASIGKTVKEVDAGVHFLNSSLFKKIENILYVPVVKEGTMGDWYILDAINVNLSLSPDLKVMLTEDYDSVAEHIRASISTGSLRSMTAKPHKYFQVRPKDSRDSYGNYHPLHHDGVRLTDKNYAIYFTQRFLLDIWTHPSLAPV